MKDRSLTLARVWQGLFLTILISTASFAQGIGASRTSGGALSTTQSPSGAEQSALATSAPAGLNNIDDSYRLGARDKLKVTVYGEDDLSGEFLVDGSGQLQLPLIGQVKASGLTVHEFTEEVRQILASKYLRDPKVSVQIENYRPFYIMGEVNKPGEYPYENNLNVLGAVALAGGYTYRANDTNVFIRRNSSLQEEKFPATALTQVNPGDIVRVEERIF